MFTLLDILKDIDEEAKDYLFKDKTAQQKIDFPEMKHDGMDGARASLKIAEM
jgi:hypothetical protein